MTQSPSSENKKPGSTAQSSIGKFASAIGFLSLISIVASFLYCFYLAMRPCRNDFICEAPPYFFFYLIVALICSVLNMVGWLSAKEASAEEQPQVSEKTTQAVQLNLTLLLLCLGYVLFFVSVVALGY